MSNRIYGNKAYGGHGSKHSGKHSDKSSHVDPKVMSPEEFANSNLPGLSGVMAIALADFSKGMMLTMGCTKADMVKWCCERFERGGKYNVPTLNTDLKLRDGNTGQATPFVLKSGLVFEVNQNLCRDVIIDTLRAVFPEQNTLLRDLENLQGSTHFVLWKMYKDPVGADIDIFGLQCSLPSEGGPAAISGTPYVMEQRMLMMHLASGLMRLVGETA